MLLRPYQLRALDMARAAFAAKKRAVLLVAPTGSGKTVCAGEVIRGAIAKGGRVVFAAHRRELVSQCSQRLRAIGVEHGIVAADMPGFAPHHPVQVASIQTLRARPNERPPASLLVLDEAHHSRAGSFATLMEAYGGQTRVLGLTATPIRLDGQGLGECYDAMVQVAQPKELIRDGFLVPVSGYAYQTADPHDVDVRGADYDQAQLGAKMHDGRIIGDIVGQWRAHASQLLTVVFAVHCEHSEELVDAFVQAGVPAEHIDGGMPNQKRDAILARWRSGQTRVVSNCQVLGEGYDLPQIGCVILAAPTKSLSLFLQRVGRGMRPACLTCGRATDPRLPVCQHCGSASIKRTARLHDHSGGVICFGLPDADRQWTLDRDGEVKDPAEKALGIRTCKRCFGCYRPTLPACPYCGHRNPKVLREIRTADGVAVPLEEIERRRAEAEKLVGPVVTSDENKRGHYFQLKRIQVEKEHKPGWVGIVYKSKYGNWPPQEWADQFPEWYARWKTAHPGQYPEPAAPPELAAQSAAPEDSNGLAS